MLGFFAPVIQQGVLEERRQITVGRHALAIVRLREQLNVQRERQHGPAALGQHGSSDVVGLPRKAVARGHCLCRQDLHATEQLLVLQLLVAEADQCLESHLVTE